MSHQCCDEPGSGAPSASFRRALVIALALNIGMFGIEVAAGLAAGSVALQADALDFFGDAANYALSLSVLALAPVQRARAALVKAASMALFGVWVLGAALVHAWRGVVPDAATMGAVGVLALAVNVGVALLLYRYRAGDANMRSVWLCSRNDAIGNLAVLGAALGVAGTGTPWPDLAVATVMATLALASSAVVIRAARAEIVRERYNVTAAPMFPPAE
ncbi:MAG: cation transporter [Alphaproteobacteria bacterium]